MVRPGDAIRTQKRFNRVFIAGRMFHHFATGANALVRLNMGAGGHFCKKPGRICCIFAFKGQDTGWFVHDKSIQNKNSWRKNDRLRQ